MPYHTDVIGTSEVSFLADLSPNDKRWDVHKTSSLRISELYLEAEFKRLSERISECSRLLIFGWITENQTGESKLKLEHSDFCRCRFCTVCQDRRQMKWYARFAEAVPKVLGVYPKHRFILLTLTIKSPEIDNLRDTIKQLNKAWQKLTQRKFFPGIGCIKAVEVTRSKDDMPHPHIHALIMVKSGYFSSSYISHEKWVQNWKSCLKVEYDPWVNIKAVKPNPNKPYKETVMMAVLEVAKYQVKAQDVIEVYPENKPVTRISNAEWLAKLTVQLHGTRAVSASGVLKQFISEDEPDEDPESNEDSQQHEDQIIFGFRERWSKYATQNGDIT